MAATATPAAAPAPVAAHSATWVTPLGLHLQVAGQELEQEQQEEEEKEGVVSATAPTGATHTPHSSTSLGLVAAAVWCCTTCQRPRTYSVILLFFLSFLCCDLSLSISLSLSLSYPSSAPCLHSMTRHDV